MDVSHDQIVFHIELTSSPRDITVIPSDQLAVTLRDEERIQLLTTRKGLTKAEQMRTVGNCRGFKYDDRKLIVAFDGKVRPKIEILRLNGEVQCTFQLNELGSMTFTEPICKGFSPDSSWMYVTDLTKLCLFRLSRFGNVTGTFGRHRYMGLAVSAGGSVYACSMSSNSVFQSPDDLSEDEAVLNINDDIEATIALAISNVKKIIKLFLQYFLLTTVKDTLCLIHEYFVPSSGRGIAGTCGSRPCSPKQRCLPSNPPRCINIDISTIQCHVEGKWEEKTCVPKDCGQPTTENGIATLLDSSNTTYMALATVTCNEGYETNISHVRCQSDGTWSAGNCSKTNCGQPTTENGFAKLLDSSDTRYMALATVMCNGGYETNISHVTCQSDGTWSAGNCSIISCGSLPSIANGVATLSLPGSTLYLDTATLDCNFGFTATPATFKCLSSKSWEHSHCACMPPDNYTGSLDSTKNGYTCQRWDSQIPHHHTETNDSLYPDTSVSAANNYCRSIGRGYLWCFITYEYLRWDYCNEPTYIC
ncbi:uncharacterized protein LOC132755845 [Ruditapes philippinarum]|uniref:uncharacterized protein LOC132755845 n=1 Tax=Ruditapes philippinarum TaxID=129788 RepID=UPI00295A6341|nr:uncharacterized protein LOC132755845 [Ruditapes philippinarum]